MPQSKSSKESSESEQLKKPTTSLIIKSKSEYASNFKAVISQNLKIKTKIGAEKNNFAANLVKLVISNCELKNIDKSIFDLLSLTHLDMSENKLTHIDSFRLERLEELNLSQNSITTFGKDIFLPRLVSLDISHNKLTIIDKKFCINFKNVSKMRVNNNLLTSICHNFGYFFMNLKLFYGSNNQLSNLPYSWSHMRLEMLELNDNPFVYALTIPNVSMASKKFPTLVELSARQVVNKK